MTRMLSAEDTARLLPFPALCDTLAATARDYRAGRIASPPRHVLPLQGEGVMLSMPASAGDIAIHKLVSVCPANAGGPRPTIQGVVSIMDGAHGGVLLQLDGPTVTARRTAAVSMLALRSLHAGAMRKLTLIGTGGQAAAHLAALADCYPGVAVEVLSRSLDSAKQLCDAHAALPLRLTAATRQAAEDSSAVIAVTTALQPVYLEAARADRLLIGVGAFKPAMAEFGPDTVRASQLFVDDPAGAPHEAGDLLQAGVDWADVGDLVDALDGKGDARRPRLFKSVGCAAWDLAAARCALAHA